MFLNKLFAPTEIKFCLGLLDNFVKTNDNFSISLVKNEVEEMLLDKKRTLYSLLQDKTKPLDLVLLLIANAAQRKLLYGHYHTYRGVLSFNGKNLFSLWCNVNQELVSTAFQTEENYNEDRKNLLNEIKQIG